MTEEEEKEIMEETPGTPPEGLGGEAETADETETPAETRSARERLLERLRGKHPDKSFEDDEELFGAIGDDYDGHDRDAEELGRFREDDKMLRETLARDPRSAQMLIDVVNGGDPVISLVRRFGTEIRDVLDDPEAQDKIAEANKEYIEKMAEGEKLEEECKANLDRSIETLRSFKEERGLTDDEADALFGFVMDIVRDGIMNKFTAETLEMAHKAMRRDADVAAAREEGEVAGRNARITERLRKADKGDGTSPLGGSNNAAPQGPRGISIFDMADMVRH